MKKRLYFIKFNFLAFYLLLSCGVFAQKLSYTVHIPAPHTHYCQVEIRLEGVKKPYIDFKMPVWTPGSYLIREFSKNVEADQAKDVSGKALKVQKITKNTWRVFLEKSENVIFSYQVYAFEHSVRTSFIDDSHAFLNGGSIFMFPDDYQNLSSTITINPPKNWQKISTGLEKAENNDWVRTSPNFDVLADSPIEVGNHQILTYNQNGIPHNIVMYGEGADYNPQQLTKDIRKITEEATKVFGENPCKEYTFIVHNVSQGGGGLEHLNSTALIVERQRYDTQAGYFSFISLAAHEYFHLWNVKRLRPTPLGPFDYDNENYTRQLWIAEGFTDYYDNLIPRRAGFSTPNGFIGSINDMISAHETSPGSKVQSLTESSFDAWVKAYRPNENSGNTTISYYGSGARVAAMLDLLILYNSNGEKNLDDLMRYLYQEYYKKLNRPFTEEEFKKATEMIAGEKLDDFFQKCIYGVETIDYNRFLGYAGLRLVVEKDDDAVLGARYEDNGGKIIVRYVRRGTAAYQYGLSVNDEILGIDGRRLSVGLINQYIAKKSIGDKITLLIARDGLIKTIELVLGDNNSNTYRITAIDNPSDKQRLVLNRWIGNK
jgi:predicted metalloprotease with PDZ domain